MKKLSAALAALALVTALFAGCSEKSGQTFSGTVVDVSERLLTVQGDGATYSFSVTDDTAFSGRPEGAAMLSDSVIVTYSGKLDSAPDAISVAITSLAPDPEGDPEVCEGVIAAFSSTQLTVEASDGAGAATFETDSFTAFEGEPQEGAAVRVEFSGALDEDPHADAVVISQQPASEKITVTGVVAEYAYSRLVLTLTSRHSLLFSVVNDTVIDGEAQSVARGDRVRVAFIGSLYDSPVAEGITIISHGDAQGELSVSGTVISDYDSSFTANIGGRDFRFYTNSSTEYSGDEITVGASVSVAFTGLLSSSPTAVAVSCAAPQNASAVTSDTADAPASSQSEASQNKDGDAPQNAVYTGEVETLNGVRIGILTDGGYFVTLQIGQGSSIPYALEVGDKIEFEYDPSTLKIIRITKR